jgi:hypothetical protein
MSGPPDPKPIRIKKPKIRFIKRKPKVKKKRVKLPSIKSLKAKAWSLFSIFIRKRDSVNGIGTCRSCGITAPWQEMQAGHFISGRTNAVLFDERITNSQCPPCNIWKHGNLYAYGKFMEAKYGKEEVDKLIQESKVLMKRGRADYLSLIAKYEGA